MLNSNQALTQRAALHGLYHLAHPHGKELIQRFLAARRALDRETRDYAEAVLAGDVQ
jgi:hypothetical protein